jgi:DamX protein
MSALTKNINISDNNTSVTKISAQARIDYILRFSKQAILVIDESVEQNTTISNQLLANLPEQHNVAYVALSSQFNNIQIRCRIIEQLYTGELFEPEISLAVSVINLAKKSKQSISINC